MGNAPVPTLQASVAPADPSHTGMGAIPYNGGVTFRVWEMFGDSVSVVGDFNGWTPGATPLARDGVSNYWSVDVFGATVGQAYKFYIPYAANPGNSPYRVDPYASSIQQSNGNMNALVASQDTPYVGGGYTTPAWNQAVIYELHIPTFSTQPDGSAGTFDSALSKLPDLADMGINAIEIMPLGEFEGITSTGYNPGYIFAVEDTFGGPDGFRDFVNQAHALGIAVIVDVVYNHLAGTDLWQFDGWSQAGNCPYDGQQVDGGIYFFEDYRAHTDYSHARFDFGRPEVCQYVFDNAMRWLNQRYADGLRFDSVVNIRAVQVKGSIVADVSEGTAILQRINQGIQDSQGWKITIAEDLQGDGQITAPLNGGGYGFNAQWNNDFCGSLRNAAIAPVDSGRNIPGLASAIAAISNGNAFRSVIYSENHDQDDPGHWQGGRLPNLIGNGQFDSWFAKKQSTLAAAVVMTAPGLPMIFEGQEFLEYAPFPDSGPAPQPIDWGLRTQFAGIRNLYRDLIHLRRDWFNNTGGLRGANTNVLPVFADNVLVYHRWDQGGPGDDVVVIVNFANQSYTGYAIGLPRPGLWRVRFNSDSSAYDAYFGNWNSFDTAADGPPLNGMPCSGSIGIAAYTCVILSQD
jgi:1,4-alpha-glucan branching enzyme